MGTRVQIMGLEVDLMTEESLKNEIERCLSNDYLNLIHIISVEYFEETISSSIRGALAEADFVLPGENAILSGHHVDVLEAGGMVVNYHGMVNVLRTASLAGKKTYYIMRNKDEARAFYQLVKTLKLKDECVGIYAADGKMTQEALINDINVKLPDLVFLSLDKEEQEVWIGENKQKLNTKLCLCIGSVLPLIRRENPYIPKLFSSLHLEWMYRRVFRIPNSHLMRKRIFKKKMANYNNK